LINIRLSMGCEYRLEYQGLIEHFLSSYVVLLHLSYNNGTTRNICLIIYVLSWHIKLAQNKVSSGSNRGYVRRRHEEWLSKNVRCL
jgi:hypothetical protein